MNPSPAPPPPARRAHPSRGSRPSQPASRRSLQIGFGVTALALALVVLFLIRDVIGAFVIGALIAFVVAPAADMLHDHLGVPRVVAIIVLLSAIVGAAAGLISAIVPLLTEEVSSLIGQAPSIASAAQQQLTNLQGHPLTIGGIRVDLSGTTDTIATHAREFVLGQFGNAVSLGITAITTAFQVVLMLIVAFLFAHDSHRIKRFLRNLVPTDYRIDYDDVWGEIQVMLFNYIRGQLVIAALIGVSSGVAVQLLGLPYALALGLAAGVTSLVPYLGPFLGALPAVLVGLAQSPQKAALVAVAYLVVSNVILNFVFPKVVGDAVRLRPILVIVAFIAGFSLGGILGMFVAIPVAATLRILYDHVHPRVFGPGPVAAADA